MPLGIDEKVEAQKGQVSCSLIQLWDGKVGSWTKFNMVQTLSFYCTQLSYHV